MRKLDRSYFLDPDVVGLSKDLIGKVICSNINNEYCSAIITETEAYAGVNDKASHAYGGRRTKRTEVMYAEGGIAYVYLCYGIHFLFNLVTNLKEVPHAILIRGGQALEGKEHLLKRRSKNSEKNLINGPGKFSQALGINLKQNGIDLLGDTIWLEDRGISIPLERIKSGPRIGIDYAEEDANLPYRFIYEDEIKIKS